MSYADLEDKFFSEHFLDNKDTFYPLDMIVKPMLGRKVYVVNLDGKEIYGFEVYARGHDFFITKGTETWKPEYREIRYDEYGSRWFFLKDEAKEKLNEYLTDEEVIVDEDEDFAFVERS